MKKLAIYLGVALLIVNGYGYAQFDSSLQNQKTILAHTHTQEQNILHQKYCSQLGGIDITDDSDIHIGPNTTDAIFCKITDKNKFIQIIPYATMGVVNDAGEPQISNIADSDVITQLDRLIPNGTFRAVAANGTVKMNQNWYATGTGIYDDVNAQSSIKEEAPSFGCYATNEAYVGSGTLTATMICGPSQVPSTYNYATACVNGSGCAQDKGIINFQK
jgi:hypothetical protein